MRSKLEVEGLIQNAAILMISPCFSTRLIYDMTECKALKSLFNVTTPLDPDVFDSSTQPVKFTLRPKEDIYIPFLYSSNATKEQFDYTVSISLSVHILYGSSR